MVREFLRKRSALKYALPAALAACLAIILADQLVKHIVVVRMNLREVGAIDLFPGLNLRMAWNTGVNFGLFSNGGDAARWTLIAGTGLVGAVLVLASLACRTMTSAVGLGVAAGGAIGNVIDRITWGAVADFLNVACCGIENPWSFNIADIAIFVGFGLLLLPVRRPAPAAPTGSA